MHMLPACICIYTYIYYIYAVYGLLLLLCWQFWTDLFSCCFFFLVSSLFFLSGWKKTKPSGDDLGNNNTHTQYQKTSTHVKFPIDSFLPYIENTISIGAVVVLIVKHQYSVEMGKNKNSCPCSFPNPHQLSLIDWLFVKGICTFFYVLSCTINYSHI